MASVAQRLPVGDVVTCPASCDRHHMVGVGLTLLGAQPAAARLLALPCVSRQHGQPPRPVCGVAVPSLVGVGPGRLVTPVETHPCGLMGWYACWHHMPAASTNAASIAAESMPNAAAIATSVLLARWIVPLYSHSIRVASRVSSGRDAIAASTCSRLMP